MFWECQHTNASYDCLMPLPPYPPDLSVLPGHKKIASSSFLLYIRKLFKNLRKIAFSAPLPNNATAPQEADGHAMEPPVWADQCQNLEGLILLPAGCQGHATHTSIKSIPQIIKDVKWL
jgi:hypothetical protein